MTVAPATAPQMHAAGLPDKPSIAVLAVPEHERRCLSRNTSADGMVEDIITTLSKLSGLRVIARNSSFTYKGKAVDIREAARHLGVRHVLEGSVRKVGNRVRITAQLIDAHDGAHVWAERYDRPVDDIFAIQDEITLVLATEMQVKLLEGEQAKLRYTTTKNVEAWSLYVQGLSCIRQGAGKDICARALTFYGKALALDPLSAPLNAAVGFVHWANARFGWCEDRATELEKSQLYTEKALELDPDNADAHTNKSLALMLQEQFDASAASARRAVQLAPGSADVATMACFALASAGYPHEAAPLIENAMKLSPNYPPSYLGHLGNAYRLTGRFEEAIAAFKAYDARVSGAGLTDLVIAYQQTNRPELAKQTAERLLAVRPTTTVESWLDTPFVRIRLCSEPRPTRSAVLGIPHRTFANLGGE